MLALCVPFVYFFLPETAGKTLEELDYIFVKNIEQEQLAGVVELHGNHHAGKDPLNSGHVERRDSSSQSLA